MTIRKLILLLVTIAAIAVLTACSSSSSPAPPPPPPTPISVSFQTAPPGSLVVATTTSVTAVVANDSSNAGVDWTVTCGSADCGSFSPTHTASGAATTYTAPAAIPAGNTVTISATSTKDTSKKVSATITITLTGFSNASLNGSYVFEVLGTDNTFLLYQLAGVLTADGNGNITGGELTYSDQSNLVINAPITGSTYSIGADGRGTITATSDPSIGNAGTLTFDVVVISSGQALITQFDTSATSSGTMDLQTAVAAPTGGYSFVVNGVDFVGLALASGGVFNIDSPGTISGAGSVADIDEGGTIANSVTVTGTVSAPDSFGAVTVDLTINGTADEFIGYILDATHIKLVEDDNNGSTAGQAIGQGAATGTFDNTAFSGTFVYGISGQSINGPAAFTAVFTADGAGNLTNGVTDESLGGVVISDTLTGTYAVDSSGTGRAAATTTFGINGAGPALIFYLTGNGNPPLVLNADSPLGSPLSLGAGIALPQAAGPFSFNGPYGMNFAIDEGGTNEADGNAQVTADTLAGTYTGTVDVNIEDFFAGTITPKPDVPLSGTFTSNANGRFPGTITVNTSTVSTALYFADSTQGFIIETDSVQVAIGPFFTQQ